VFCQTETRQEKPAPEKYKKRPDCTKYVSKDDLTIHYIFYHLYSNLGLIITIGILILLLSQMPLFASVMVIILLILDFGLNLNKLI
jgi:hypothetical protein